MSDKLTASPLILYHLHANSMPLECIAFNIYGLTILRAAVYPLNLRGSKRMNLGECHWLTGVFSREMSIKLLWRCGA